MEMPGAEGWPLWPLEEGVDSSIALSSDLVILEAETASETDTLIRCSKTMEKILRVARKNYMTVKEATRRREGSAQGGTRRKGGRAPQNSEGESFSHSRLAAERAVRSR